MQLPKRSAGSSRPPVGGGLEGEGGKGRRFASGKDQYGNPIKLYYSERGQLAKARGEGNDEIVDMLERIGRMRFASFSGEFLAVAERSEGSPVAPSFEGERDPEDGMTDEEAQDAFIAAIEDDDQSPSGDDLVAYRHRFCGGRVHLAWLPTPAGAERLAAVCGECGDTDGLDLEAVVVAEAQPKAHVGKESAIQHSGGQPAVGNDVAMAIRSTENAIRFYAKARKEPDATVIRAWADALRDAAAFAERSEAPSDTLKAVERGLGDYANPPSPVLYDELREALGEAITEAMTEGWIKGYELADVALKFFAAQRPYSPAPIPKEDE